MNDFIELRRVVNIIQRRWWLLFVMATIGAIVGYSISMRQAPVYQATATMLVGQLMQSTNLNKEDVQMSVGFAQTYSDIAIRQPVLEGVVEKLNLKVPWQELRDRVRVTFVEGTQLIVIKVEDTLPERAQAIAGEVANQLILLSPTDTNEGGNNSSDSFIGQEIDHTEAQIRSGQARISEIEAELQSPLTSEERSALQAEKSNLEKLIADSLKNYVDLTNLAEQQSEPNSLSIIEQAQIGKSPIRPSVKLNILLGGGLGLILALVLIFLWEYLDDTFKSAEDLSQIKDLDLIGSIGRIKGRSYSEKLITRLKPYSSTIESFRMIRNKINLGSANQPVKSIVITSAGLGDGKSITAANLGAIMAQAKSRTIIIDADFRYPTQHLIFDVKNQSGLGELLDSADTEIGDYLKDTGIKNLRIMTSGKSLVNSSELMSSERMSEILKYLSTIADTILIDSPPVLLASDALLLSNRADKVILVVRAGKTRRAAVRKTLSDIREANANLIGCIFNQVYINSPWAVFQTYQRRENLIQRQKTLLSIIRRHQGEGEFQSTTVRVKEKL